MNGGARQIKDCCTYFGTKLKNENNINIVDFLIKEESKKHINNQNGNSLIFMIYYKKGK